VISMMFLPFYVKESKYALSVNQVLEVIPRVELRQLPHAPNYVGGVFNFRGSIVPVIDLCSLLQESPCTPYFGTRIILIRYQVDGISHILGLMAERVTGILRVTGDALKQSGVQIADAPYLGEIITEQQEMIQIIQPERLLPDAVKKMLFIEPMERL